MHKYLHLVPSDECNLELPEQNVAALSSVDDSVATAAADRGESRPTWKNDNDNEEEKRREEKEEVASEAVADVAAVLISFSRKTGPTACTASSLPPSPPPSLASSFVTAFFASSRDTSHLFFAQGRWGSITMSDACVFPTTRGMRRATASQRLPLSRFVQSTSPKSPIFLQNHLVFGPFPDDSTLKHIIISGCHSFRIVSLIVSRLLHFKVYIS